MNWTNYDRLVAHLNGLLERGSETFNYRNYAGGKNGCVACHCKMLANAPSKRLLYANDDDIEEFLCVTSHEAITLFSAENVYLHNFGETGIRAALARLAFIAARYERPDPPALFHADDAAFLAKCRAVAREPEPVTP